MATFNFGERQSVESYNRGVQLSADGFPKAKPGGAEFDWTTVTALAKDTYLTDQLDDASDPQGVDASGADSTTFANSKALSDARPVAAGMKVLRYGTPIQRRASDGLFVLALTGGPKARGDIYLVNETVVFDPSVSATTQVDPKTLYPIAIDGGRVFKARLVTAESPNIGVDVDGANVGSGVTLTLADLELALPNITYALD